MLNHASLLGYNKEVLDQIAKPVLFQCSDNDSQIPTEFRHEIEEKLQKLPFKKHTLLKFYPGESRPHQTAKFFLVRSNMQTFTAIRGISQYWLPLVHGMHRQAEIHRSCLLLFEQW